MKQTLKILLAAAILFAALPASAGPRIYNLGTLIDGVALNAGSGLTVTIGPHAETTATVRLPPDQDPAGFRMLTLFVDYTHSNSDDLVITVTVGRTVATATFAPNWCTAITSGACTSSGGGVFNIAVTGDTERSLRAGIFGYPVIKIVASHATADGSDVLTLTGVMVE